MNTAGQLTPRRSLLSRLLRPIIVVPCVLVALLLASPFLIRQYHLSQIPVVELPLDQIGKLIDQPRQDGDGLDAFLKATDAIPDLLLSAAYQEDESTGLPILTADITNLLEEHTEAYELLRQAADRPWPHSVDNYLLDSTPKKRPFLKADRLIACRIARSLHQGDADLSIEGFLLRSQVVKHVSFIDRIWTDKLPDQDFRMLNVLCTATNLDLTDLNSLQSQLQERLRAARPSFAEKLLVDCYTSQRDDLQLKNEQTAWKLLSSLEDGYEQSDLEYWLRAGPELLHRFEQQVAANLVPHVDLPLWKQPPFLTAPKVRLFRLTSTERPKNGLPAETLYELSKFSNELSASLRVVCREYELELRDRSRLAILPVIVALYRFQRAHGRFPDAMQELVPDFLNEVPLDPCDRVRVPLRYRLEGSNFVLWSIGPDFTDENGDELADVSARSRSAAISDESHETSQQAQPKHAQEPPTR